MDRSGQMFPSTDPDHDKMVARPRRPAYGGWLLIVLLLAGAGYFAQRGWYERARLLAEIAQSQAKVQALSELEPRLDALELDREGLLAARDSLPRSGEARSGALSDLKGTHDKLQEKMKDEIARGEIELRQSGPRLRVALIDKILFDSGDARLSRRGKSVLLRLGEVLAGITDRQIQVSGHTDNQRITRLKKKYPSNWELSLARALTVVRFLQETAQVPPERMLAAGQGEYNPVGSNRTEKERSRNRRIEILLTPELDPRRLSRDELVAQ
jgi:chemotaxis protein MotB